MSINVFFLLVFDFSQLQFTLELKKNCAERKGFRSYNLCRVISRVLAYSLPRSAVSSFLPLKDGWNFLSHGDYDLLNHCNFVRAWILQPSKFGMISRWEFDVKTASLSTKFLRIRNNADSRCMEHKHYDMTLSPKRSFAFIGINIYANLWFYLLPVTKCSSPDVFMLQTNKACLNCLAQCVFLYGFWFFPTPVYNGMWWQLCGTIAIYVT